MTSEQLENRRVKHRQVMRRQRQRKVQVIAAWKLAHGCEICGIGAWPSHVLQLHHTDPAAKEGDARCMQSWSEARIYAELGKCQVLCANHHAMEEHGDD